MGVERSPKKGDDSEEVSVKSKTTSKSPPDPMSGISGRLKKLRKNRGHRRTIATKEIIALELLLDSATVDSAEDVVLDTDNIKARIKTLTELQTFLREMDDSILDLMDEDDETMQTEIEDGIKCQQLIETILSKAERILHRANEEANSQRSNANDDAYYSHPRMYKLPQLQLPTFSGDVLAFGPFYDQFMASVGDDPKIPKTAKLQMLLSLLRDDAKRSLSGFKIRENEYQNALDTLLKQYNNQLQIIEKHILELINLQPPSYDYLSLHRFQSDIECHTRSLKTLNIIDDSKGFSIFVGTLIAYKLPSEIKERINWDKQKANWDLNLVGSALSGALTVLESEGHHLDAAKKDNKGSNNAKKNNNNNDNRNKQSRYDNNYNMQYRTNNLSSYVVNSNVQSSSPANSSGSSQVASSAQRSRVCRLCRDPNHYANDCHIYNTLASRLDCINRLRLCQICLGFNHDAESCFSTKPCYYCGQVKIHNSSICPTAKKEDAVKSNQSIETPGATASQADVIIGMLSTKNKCSLIPPVFQEGFSLNKPIPSIHERAGEVLVTTSKDLQGETIIHNDKGERFTSLEPLPPDSCVALPLARVIIHNNGNKTNCLSLLDSGSQRSLITKAMVEKVHFYPTKRVEMSIIGINDKTGDKRIRDIVKCEILTADGMMTINAVVVDALPGNICMPGLVETTRLLHSNRIPLSYPDPKSDIINEVHLLIGADSLHRFVNRNKIAYGINLMNTNIGDVIWGPLAPTTNTIPDCYLNMVTVLGSSITKQNEIENYKGNKK